jgi:hypothetical protein
MNPPKSFVPSDFSVREIPGFLLCYVVISVICVAGGLVLQALPPFWGGSVFGFGIGLLASMKLIFLDPRGD